jgi:GT2 family glycosyltransferase
MISIVVVTHNALQYILRLLRSLGRTETIPYELVVVDNRSRFVTRAVLAAAALTGRIQRLCLLERNVLFAPGNNIGVAATNRTSRYVLLLNSDVEVRDPSWLRRLLELHERGATAFGFVEGGPVPRADGYCLLVDRDLILETGLDEEFEWYWSITKLQAELLTSGHRVRAVRDHDHLLYHFGGKSGPPARTRSAKGMTVDRGAIAGWFGDHSVEVIDRA